MRYRPVVLTVSEIQTVVLTVCEIQTVVLTRVRDTDLWY